MAVSSGDRFSKSGDEEETNAGEGQNKDIGNRKTNKFDPGAPPPFKIADIRAAIPAHCWVKNPWRSLSYVVWDIAAVAALLAAAVYINSWVFWPVYWIAQGTMFWALFVLGHECGHGSFSDSTMLNNVVGYALHSSILVPYQSWRIGHRKHHQNHGHVDHDEAWAPTPERLYKEMKYTTKILIFRMPILALPFYLVNGIPSRPGSHFNPSNELFKPEERNLVIASDICCAAMLAFLFYASIIVGPILILKLYAIPYLVFVVWFDLVTYVHHHGSEEKLPWYRGQEWSYLRGALTTTDEDYGLINKIHHDIGTHIVHHLFPQIPHYHLVEATREAKKVLGSYYREPQKSGPVPFHIFSLLIKSVGRDHYVSDNGDIVYYQTDEELFRPKKI